MTKRSISNCIYILSNPLIGGRYKLGIHRGDLRKLHRRYQTYIPNVRIHYFIEDLQARKLESQFKQLHAVNRIPFPSTGEIKSEWFQMPLDLMISTLLVMMVGNDYGLNEDGTFKIYRLESSIQNTTRIVKPRPDN